MIYNKPEAVKLDSALSAIQGVEKPMNPTTEDHAAPYLITATPNAYESDE
jgi:hypothetical protein